MNINMNINKILEDLADISYTALDLKENIISDNATREEMMKRITLIHKVLTENHQRLLEVEKYYEFNNGRK